MRREDLQFIFLVLLLVSDVYFRMQKNAQHARDCTVILSIQPSPVEALKLHCGKEGVREDEQTKH